MPQKISFQSHHSITQLNLSDVISFLWKHLLKSALETTFILIYGKPKIFAIELSTTKSIPQKQYFLKRLIFA